MRPGRPSAMSPTLVDRPRVEAAGLRLRRFIRQTPLVCDSSTGIWLKCENEQHTGSFKLRGALNRCLLLSPDDLKRGIVAASAGNHGQGVAYAARLLGARATIVVPAAAGARQIAGIGSLGGDGAP